MKNLNHIVWIVFAVCLSACVKDGPDVNDDPDTNKTYIALSLESPVDITTYSVASANECTISDAYLLVFEGENHKYIRAERITLSNIENNGQKNPILKTSLSIPDGAQIVALLNTGCTFAGKDVPLTAGVSTTADINTAFPPDGWLEKCNGLGENSGKSLPMCGEIIWASSSPTINIYRSVAKIQLKLNIPMGEDITGSFTTAADAVKWGMYQIASTGNIYSTGGSLNVPNAGILNFSNSSALPQRVLGAQEAKIQSQTFYCPEYPNASMAQRAAVDSSQFAAGRTCLIVHTLSGYYRLDLAIGNAFNQEKKFLDIERNHHYTVTITKVKSKGYATAEQALANPGSNLEYEILVAEDNNNVVTSNGQYAISVECDEIITFSQLTEAYAIDLYDAEFSLKAKIITGVNGSIPTPNTIQCSSGISLTSISTLSDVEQDIKVKMIGRTTNGVITITVGNIVKEIKLRRERNLDASYDQRTLTGDFSRIKWVKLDDNFQVSINGTSSMTIKCKENITPTNQNALIDKEVEPIFEKKTAIGYATCVRGFLGMTKVLVTQAAPEYVGWEGGTASNRKRLILGATEPPLKAIARGGGGDRDDGKKNVAYLMSLPNPDQYEAAYYCYMKNDANGDGQINNGETLEWYLPAMDQLIYICTQNHIRIKAYPLDSHPSHYWSSTYKDRAIYVATPYANISITDYYHAKYRVRCVRDL